MDLPDEEQKEAIQLISIMMGCIQLDASIQIISSLEKKEIEGLMRIPCVCE